MRRLIERVGRATALAVAVQAACAGAPRVPAGGAPSHIVLGPMVGHTTDHSVRLWLRADRPGRLVALAVDSTGAGVARGVVRLRVADSSMGVVEVDGLKPRTRYDVRFVLEGQALDADPPVEFRTFPPPGASGRRTIAVVSCARIPWDSVQSVWGVIDRERPDVLVWLGDNGYLEHADSTGAADYGSRERIEFRYAQIKRLASLQPVLRHVPNYAIWDDRDYDGSDSNRNFPLRDAVTRIFMRYWANPFYGGPGLDGIWSDFRLGDIHVFLLDDRFWRDPDSLPDAPDKTLLGERQKRWLEETLAASDARVKVIAIGNQVMGDYHHFESYANFPHERKELFDWIRERKIGGVVLVDGDRHLTELIRYPLPGAYPIYELTSSPVANEPFYDGLEIPDSLRVAGYSASESYGLLEIDTRRPGGSIAFVAKDPNGREVLRHEVPLDSLEFHDR